MGPRDPEQRHLLEEDEAEQTEPEEAYDSEAYGEPSPEGSDREEEKKSGEK